MMSSSMPDGIDLQAMLADKDDRDYVRHALSLFYNQRPDMHVHNGIAEIHLYGPMLFDASPIELGMGATAYEEIREEIQLANEDDEVQAVILVCNTPGGTVQGIEEVYQDIKSSSKPFYAYVETSATSAGYYLASACENITVSPSSVSGNIGTVLTYWDLTEVYEAMGAKQEVFTNEGATLKGTFAKPLSDEQRVFVQAMVDEIGEQFKARVLENRPDVDPEVFKAGWYSPEKAGELGLVDYEGTLAELRGMILTNNANNP